MDMTLTAQAIRRGLPPLAVCLLVLFVIFGAVFRDRWRREPTPQVASAAVLTKSGPAPARPSSHGHDHGGNHHDHGEVNTLELSEQAQQNIGLRVTRIEPKPFSQSISVPAMIVPRPGRSRIHVTTPMSGIVTRVHALEGGAVEPGQKLFDLRMMHEDLIQAQGAFLQTTEELLVVRREIARLEKVVAQGAIARRSLLQRQYEEQKLLAALTAQRQALMLHGLSREQTERIVTTRELIHSLTVTAPRDDENASRPGGFVLTLHELTVDVGQHVAVGQTLGVLADHSELYIEADGFQRDLEPINRAAAEGWPIRAIISSDTSQPEELVDLEILYVGDEIGSESRTFRVYVSLPNEIVDDRQMLGGQRYVVWRFVPGRRVTLKIPVESPRDRIVLPVEAVVQDGPETYVFRRNGDRFERLAVQVEYRDTEQVIVAERWPLLRDATVVVVGAYQMQLALKNRLTNDRGSQQGHGHPH